MQFFKALSTHERYYLLQGILVFPIKTEHRLKINFFFLVLNQSKKPEHFEQFRFHFNLSWSNKSPKWVLCVLYNQNMGFGFG